MVLPCVSKDRIGGPIRFSLPPPQDPRDRAAAALNETHAFGPKRLFRLTHRQPLRLPLSRDCRSAMKVSGPCSSALRPPHRADRGDRAQVLDQHPVDGESTLA
jgi:hypothetical protein